MDKSKAIKMLKLEIPIDMDEATLYGIELREFDTVEELRTVAYWALTKYHTLLEHG